jgi:probable rRNA maturation factor
LIKVTVVKATRVPLTARSLRAVLQAAAAEPEVARRLGSGAGRELTLRVTGDAELRRLNARFLGQDEATDVLSFPSGEPEGYLGDLALSWPAVVRQAAAFGHPVEEEAALLSVHGFLHLLGLDHATRSQAQEMDTLTQACLARAGFHAPAGRLTAPT